MPQIVSSSKRLLIAGVGSLLDFLAALTVPLILLTEGYGIKLDRKGLRSAGRVVLTRVAVIMPTLLILNFLLVRQVLQLDWPYEAALFTLFIARPPFIIPLFMDPKLVAERRSANNVLTLYTVVTIAIFKPFFGLNPAL